MDSEHINFKVFMNLVHTNENWSDLSDAETFLYMHCLERYFRECAKLILQEGVFWIGTPRPNCAS